MEYNKLLSEIGFRLYTKRKERGYTQEKLAELMDVTPQTISYAESGKKAMRAENIVKACRVLNISADYLLMGTEPTAPMSELEQKISGLSNEQKIYVNIIIDSCVNLCK